MRRREDRDRGAAALEFALVVPVLALLVFGIIDYGLFLSDNLAVKQGIREAAREAVVSDRAACGGGDLNCLADLAVDRIGAVGGATEVRVEVVRVDPVPGQDGWREGNAFLVCAVVMEDGLTGFTPIPDRIYDSVRMRIEHDTSSASSGETGTPPAGWDWCS